MREDSPRWEQINPSGYLHEQEGLRELASYLPDADPYHVWANIEFVASDGSINEVDALVLTPSGLHLVELKHWQGELRGDGGQWVRRPTTKSRLTPEDNPAILANRKAKRLASLIGHYARQQRRPGRAPYIGAAIFLHARSLRADLDPIGRQHIYGLHDVPESGLSSLRDMLLAPPRNPAHLVDAVRAREIIDLVRGARIRPSVADRKVGQLLLYPRPFAEGIGWQDFLAGHLLDDALLRRVRFYLTSRAADEDVPAIRAAAEREFRLLQGIHHPGIAPAHDMIDHPWGPAVVFDHQKDWVRLDQYLVQRGDRLTMAQRLHLLGDLAEIIGYAHSRRLAHRALHPGAVYVRDPESTRPGLVVTNWQAGGRLADTRLTRTGPSTDPDSLALLLDDEVRRYQAPEAAMPGRPPGHQLDVFSLGAVGYRIFAGQPPAATAEELATAVRDSGANLAGVVDGMPAALVNAVYDATRGDPARRVSSVAAFLVELERVWDELTAPEPEPVVDPLLAHKGDVLDVGLTVVSRLGAGSTALALLVTEPPATEGAEPRRLVLKVARDEQHATRLAAEAATLAKLRDRRVAALVKGPIHVGGRTALLMESAGERTLAEELQGGRLALDLLERFGRDLLEIVVYLDEEGVWHRDIKPANLAARPRPKDREPHLCVFDFSLASTGTDQLGAGTTGYLDPFLGPPKRLRYDLAAERFAAAVTLFEMATGALPEWGGANPAAVSDEVTIDPAMFDPAVADKLEAFFGRALARRVGDRFHTAEEMLDAWREVFRQVPQADDEPASVETAVGLTLDSPLERMALTARARSAVQRLGLVTVRDLLDAKPSTLTRARGVPDATRKEILAHVRTLRALLSAPPADELPASELTGAARQSAEAATSGVEALCAILLPPETARTRRNRNILAVLLGQAPSGDGVAPHWPTQGQVARATGQTQPQISVLLRKQVVAWLDNAALAQVRDEIVGLLESRGAVMSGAELADALVANHGSFTPEPKRTSQAIGLVRAAVEAELARGGDARLAIQRFKGSSTVLVGREPDDPEATTTAADLLGYVVRLGERAVELAKADLLPGRPAALTELAEVEAPAGLPAVAELRLLQLAAIGSVDRVDVNGQGQLYPVGMSPERALRLASGSVTGQRLSPDEIRSRVRARFPRAEELPDRPLLNDLIRDAGIPLTWQPAEQRFTPPTMPSLLSGTHVSTSHSDYRNMLGAEDEVAAKLAGAVDRRSFLAVLTPLKLLTSVRRELLSRLPLAEVNVTGILLDRLRGMGYPWQALVDADSGSGTDANFRSLLDLVRHEVVPAIREALATDAPVLLTEAAPLARYDQLGLLAELADPTRPRPAARLLLVPARKPEPPMLDGTQLPLTSPGSQSLWVAGSWLTATSGRTVHHAHPTTVAGELPRVQ